MTVQYMRPSICLQEKLLENIALGAFGLTRQTQDRQIISSLGGKAMNEESPVRAGRTSLTQL